jgi:hypothetical protein
MTLRTTAVLLLLLAAGCGPWGPLGVVPGGPLCCDEVKEPVRDWSFSDAHPLIAVETRGRFFRHSITAVCVSADGELYLMARRGGEKTWVRNLMADPRVRVEIGDRIYPVRVTRLTEALPGDPVARAFLRKYAGLEADEVHSLPEVPGEGDERIEVWIFRALWDDGADDGGAS